MTKIKFITGYGGIACDLARAVGLDPARVQSFTITVTPDDIITVTSRQTMLAEEINGLLSQMARWKGVPS